MVPGAAPSGGFIYISDDSDSIEIDAAIDPDSLGGTSSGTFSLERLLDAGLSTRLPGFSAASGLP